ncbi:MAG TPA: glycosyltransferase [Firmicutes bacterium]|nr:glycosyltransferase [Bacillota bacterium]
MISVIIPNWNGKKYLKDCLESLLNQNAENYEIIVVDNNSSDGSVEFIEQNYPDVRLFKLKRNTGFAFAVNYGIKRAKGKYIALLNNDTITDRNWLNEMKIILDSNSEIYSVCSQVLFIELPEMINSIGTGVSSAFIPFDLYITKKKDTQYSGPVLGPTGSAGMYRRTLFEKIGGFDSDFFAYFEDVDLNLRAFHAGLKSVYCRKSFIFHKMSGSTKMLSNFVFDQCMQNYFFMLIKNIPYQVYTRLFFPVSLRVIKFLYEYIKGKRPIAFIRNIIKVLRYLPSMFRKRSRILGNKKSSSSEMVRILTEFNRFLPNYHKIKAVSKKIADRTP